MDEAINLVDGEYGEIKQDARKSNNMIKTRQTSFSRIKEKWAQYLHFKKVANNDYSEDRKAVLERELESEKAKLVHDNYRIWANGDMALPSEIKMNHRTAVIARLEESIMILDSKNVPINYRQNRAIKLRRNMMDNLMANSASAYSVQKEDEEKVFVNDLVPESEQANIDVEQVSADNEEKIAEDVEQAMNNNVDLNQVVDALKDELNGLPREEEKPVEDVAAEEAINATLGEEQEPVEQEPPVQAVEEEEKPERFHISQNESTEAKVHRFNADGEEKSKGEEYVPMTDKQIEEAQNNIEYDKYEEIYRKEWQAHFDEDWQKKKDTFKESLKDLKAGFKKSADHSPKVEKVDPPVRDDVVVTPEREKEEPKKEIHMDYTDATPQDVVRAVDHENTVSGLTELKEQAVRLQSEQEKAMQRAKIATNEQIEVARQALDMKDKEAATRKKLEEKKQQLRRYCEELQEGTADIRRKADVSLEDAQINSRFIEARLEEIENMEAQMRELDSLMEIGVRGARK